MIKMFRIAGVIVSQIIRAALMALPIMALTLIVPVTISFGQAMLFAYAADIVGQLLSGLVSDAERRKMLERILSE